MQRRRRNRMARGLTSSESETDSVHSNMDPGVIRWLSSQIDPRAAPPRPKGPFKERQRNQVVPPVRRRIIGLCFPGGVGITERSHLSYAAVAQMVCVKYRTVQSIA